MLWLAPSAALGGSLQVNSVVAGAAAPPGAQFYVSVGCSLNGISMTGITPAPRQTVAAGGTVTFGNIPAGARCSVYEDEANLPPAPVGFAWIGQRLSPPNPVDIGAGTTSVTLTNSLAEVSTLTVSKAVAGGTVPNGSLFTIQASCYMGAAGYWNGIVPAGQVRISAGESATFSNIPVDADCYVFEVDPPLAPAGKAWAGVQRDFPQPVSIVAGGSGGTLTNTLADAATLTVSTQVMQGTPAPGSQAAYLLYCQSPGLTMLTDPVTQATVLGEAATFTGVPVGAECLVGVSALVLPPAGSVWAASMQSARITIRPGTNNIDWAYWLLPTTTVTVSSQVTGTAIPPGATASVGLNCSSQGAPYSLSVGQTLEVALGSSVTFTGVPAGLRCGISGGGLPAPPTGFVWVRSSVLPPSFVATAGATNSVIWTTTLETESRLVVTKILVGGDVAAGTVFSISVQCTRFDLGTISDIAPAATQSVVAGGTVTFSGIPVASQCDVREGALPPAPAGYSWGQTTVPGTVVTSAGSNALGVTNRLDPLNSVHVTPTYVGGTLPPDAVFAVGLGCSLGGYNFVEFPAQPVAPGGTANFNDLPLGAYCSGRLTPPTPPAGYTWGETTWSSGNWFYVVAGQNPVTAQSTLLKLTTLTVNAEVVGGTVAAGTTFALDTTCGTGIQHAIQVTVGTPLQIVVTPGTPCSLSQSGLAMPEPPAGFAWGGWSVNWSNTPIPAGGGTATLTSILVPLTTLEVLVTIQGAPGASPMPFPLTLACGYPFNYPTVAFQVKGITPSATSIATSGTPLLFGNVPVNANCQISLDSHPAPPAGYGWAGFSGTQAFQIAAGANRWNISATATPLTTLAVTQVTAGGTPAAGSSFSIYVSCQTPTNAFVQLLPSGTQSVAAGGTAVFDGIPAGSHCQITEDTPAPPAGTIWIGTTYSPQYSILVSGPTTATVTNTLARLGTLTVTSVVTGGGAAPVPALPVTVSCYLANYYSINPLPAATQAIAPGASATFTNIPVGASCYADLQGQPASPAGYIWTGSSTAPHPATITAAGAQATITSVFTPAASVTVSEVVTGGTVVAGTTFSATITCTLGPGNVQASPSFLYIVAGGAGDFGNIPAGSTCTVTAGARPTAPSGFVWKDPTVAPAPITVAAGSNRVTVTNTLIPVGSVSVTSVVTGGSVVAGSAFGFALDCAYPSASSAAIMPAREQSVVAGGTATWTGIPVGATCTVMQSSLPQRPVGSWWGSMTAVPNPIVVTAGTNAITVTNPLLPTTSLTITTAVTGGNAPGAQFTIAGPSCIAGSNFVSGILPAGNQIAGPSTSITFTNIPVNASCTVYGSVASPPNGYIFGTTSTSPPNAIVVPTGGAAMTYTAPLIPVAVLSVSAMVSGAAPIPGTTFPVGIACTFNGASVHSMTPGSLQLVPANGSATFGGIPVGSVCTLSVSSWQLPSAPAGAVYTAIALPAAPATIVAGPNAAAITYSLTPTRSLAVSKAVTGGAPVPGSQFTVGAACTLGSVWGSNALTSRQVEDGGTTTFDGIPVGASCSVTEAGGSSMPVAPAGANWGPSTIAPSPVTMTENGAAVTVTNTLVPVTSLSVSAVVTGGTPVTGSRFSVNVYCSAPGGSVSGITPSATQSIFPGSPATFSQIPVGASCYALLDGSLPAPPPGHAWVSTRISPASLTLAAGGGNAITVTYALAATAPVTLTKIVTGATLPPGTTFAMTLSCAPTPIPGATRIANQVTKPAAAGETITFDEAPVGANCSVSEYNGTSPPAGTVWVSTTITPSQFAHAQEGTAVTVTNRLAPLTTLSVTKAVTGGTVAAGTAFTVSLSCSFPGQPYYYGSFTPSSQQLVTEGGTIQFGGVPVGASCTPAEYSGFPTPPAGLVWAAPVITPGPILVAPTGNEVTLTNRLAAKVQLAVTRLGNGGGKVDSGSDGLINCGTQCAGTIGAGTQVILSATPSTGAYFAGWAGNCRGLGPCILDMAGSRTVTATFSVNPVTLAVVRSGSGSGSVRSEPSGIDCGATCGSLYAGGISVALTAAPDPGSTFVGWLGGCVGGLTCNVPLVADATVRAVFTTATPSAKIFDADGDGRYDALTDGLLIIRYLFGLTGSALTNGSVAAGASRGDPAAVAAHLADNLPTLDVDGDGQADALTDGLIILRYLFGLRGDALIHGATGAGATRDSGLIEEYLRGLMP